MKRKIFLFFASISILVQAKGIPHTVQSSFSQEIDAFIEQVKEQYDKLTMQHRSLLYTKSALENPFNTAQKTPQQLRTYQQVCSSLVQIEHELTPLKAIIEYDQQNLYHAEKTQKIYSKRDEAYNQLIEAQDQKKITIIITDLKRRFNQLTQEAQDATIDYYERLAERAPRTDIQEELFSYSVKLRSGEIQLPEYPTYQAPSLLKSTFINIKNTAHLVAKRLKRNDWMLQGKYDTLMFVKN